MTTAAGDREYTVTPARTYAVARERGEVTHRLMAGDLDISPLAPGLIPPALRPIVHERDGIEEAEAGIGTLDVVDDASAPMPRACVSRRVCHPQEGCGARRIGVASIR